MRQIAISPEQAKAIEQVGEELLRKGDERATKLLTVALAYRWANFECVVDESAGMAEVYDLEQHSKRV